LLRTDKSGLAMTTITQHPTNKFVGYGIFIRISPLSHLLFFICIYYN